jgi:pimeloyl-ACP methyl ester carboxylesterase
VETLHRFRSYDGTELEGTLSVGDRSRDSIVLLVHGITSSRDEFGLFSGFAEYLARRGTSSFRFDYRCHGINEQPMEFLTLSGIVNDIEAAAACALARVGALRIHVVGMSFGGGLSAFWAATTKNTVSSVVMLAPVIDYEEDIVGQHGLLFEGKLDERCWRMLQGRGFIETDGIRYGSALLNEVRYISGVEGIKRLNSASLIVHGDADTIVPYASSERFVTLNPNCRLLNIPGTEHGFGVGDDDDLSSPETKARHQEVFGLVSQFFDEFGRGT